MTACVGREREIAWVTSRLEATSAHGTGLVVVSGPAGIGKSRLLAELREQARVAGFPVLEGWCVRHAAFAPFVAIATQALAWLRARGDQELLAPGDLEALAPLVSLRPQRGPDDDDEGAIRFIEAVGRLLAAVGRVRPVLVLIRGYSHADDATRSLVRALLDAAGPAGEPTPGAPAALLVAAARTERLADLADHPRASNLALEGLDLEGVRKIVSDEMFIARLHTATGGNPDAILGLLDRPAPPRAAEVASRVAQLGEVSRHVLAALGAAGRPLPVAVLAATAGVDAQTAARAIPPLVDARMVWRDLDPSVGDVVIGLVHGDDGAVALSRLGPGEVAALHQRLGEALSEWHRVPPEEVLEHLLAGSDPAAVAARATDVATSLLRRHAPASALALLVAASAHASPAALAQFAPLAAAAAKLSGGHAEARALLARALASNPGDAELARIDAQLALAVGDLDACAAALEDATRKVREEQTDTRAAIAATRAELCYQRGSLDEAEAAAREAIALAREDDPLHTQARNALTKVFMWRGDLERGWDWTLENIARARARGATTEVLRGVINLGVIAIRRGDYDEAGRQFEAARAIAARGGTMMLRGVLKENEAVVAHLRGRFGEALALYQEALGILIRVGHRQFLARIANNLGELYVQVGETTRARRLCDYAAQVGRGLSRGVTAEGLLLRGQIELLDARNDAARSALTEALAMFTAAGEKQREHEAHLLLARAFLADGDVARAAQEIAAVGDDEAQVGVRILAERTRLEAELRRAEGRDALPAARRALDLADRAGDVDLKLRAHVQLGFALLERGDDLAARRHAEAAETLRAELVSRVPDALRVAYDATIQRTGLSQLAARLDVAAAGGTRRPTSDIAPTGQVTDRGGLIGESPPMHALRRTIARVAPADTTVLLRGESGTGKERVAEAIHRASRRKNGPLVKVNCAALAEGVLLSELFGHEKGAFTGAAGRRKGRFEAADGGTIFLDEIGDISPAMQTALLRVLQERTFERVGGNTPIRVDVRVIAATNRDLEAAMRAGAFREDLYYRLADITIKLPPLRERVEDIPLLAAWLIDQMAREDGLPARRLTPGALRRLAEYHWPGNVRELASKLKSAMLMAEGDEITADDLAIEAAGPRPVDARPSFLPPPPEKSEVEVVYDRIRSSGVSLFDMRREVEKGCIARALEEANGNITRAAALLGMKRPRLSQLVREYGLAKAGEGGDTP
jgi:transcriptional regulator with GAF, ATPase, and Fis domain